MGSSRLSGITKEEQEKQENPDMSMNEEWFLEQFLSYAAEAYAEVMGGEWAQAPEEDVKDRFVDLVPFQAYVSGDSTIHADGKLDYCLSIQGQ